MKAIGYIFAGLLILLGLLFFVAAATTGIWQRWLLGGILFIAGFLVVYFLRMKIPETKVTTTVTHQIDLSGDVQLEELNCRSCGASLDAKSVSVEAGAVFVRCPYCDSQYQIEEAPKW